MHGSKIGRLSQGFCIGTRPVFSSETCFNSNWSSRIFDNGCYTYILKIEPRFRRRYRLRKFLKRECGVQFRARSIVYWNKESFCDSDLEFIIRYWRFIIRIFLRVEKRGFRKPGSKISGSLCFRLFADYCRIYLIIEIWPCLTSTNVEYQRDLSPTFLALRWSYNLLRFMWEKLTTSPYLA